MSKLKFPIIGIAILFCSISNTYAQNDDGSKAPHDHHYHHANEIGVAIAPSYFINEKEWGYSLHLHYIRSIGHSNFGVGLSYERIFGEHKHNTFGVVGSYHPISPITILVSPGFTFEDKLSQSMFALHIETSYDFDVGPFHMGPVVEFAYDPEDIHLSLGLHIGFGF